MSRISWKWAKVPSYAYGYQCAPDRLKIGMATGDPIARVATQIGTSTPDRPQIVLVVRTPRARAFERALHAILELRDRRVIGGGAEWFLATRDELLDLVRDIGRIGTRGAAQGTSRGSGMPGHV